MAALSAFQDASHDNQSDERAAIEQALEDLKADIRYNRAHDQKDGESPEDFYDRMRQIEIEVQAARRHAKAMRDEAAQVTKAAKRKAPKKKAARKAPKRKARRKAKKK